MMKITKQWLLCTVFAFALSTGASGSLIEEEYQIPDKARFPTIERILFQMSFRHLPFDSVESLNEFRSYLETALSSMQSMTYVPYVWGGRTIGQKTECDACKNCMAQKKVRADASSEVCSSCQKCGVDCSNFAHLLFEEAHLEFPYLTSKEMAYRFADDLYDHFSLVDIGSDLRYALRGDLVVQDGHVVVFLGSFTDPKTQDRNVSYIHSSRRGEDERPAGGINTVIGRSLESFQRTVVRILRHRSFATPPAQDGFAAGEDQDKKRSTKRHAKQG